MTAAELRYILDKHWPRFGCAPHYTTVRKIIEVAVKQSTLGNLHTQKVLRHAEYNIRNAIAEAIEYGMEPDDFAAVLMVCDLGTPE